MSKYRIVRPIMSQGASLTEREEESIVLANTAPRPAGASIVTEVSDDTPEYDWRPVANTPAPMAAPVIAPLAPPDFPVVAPLVTTVTVPPTEGVI